MNNSDLHRIQHILVYCENVLKTIDRFGNSEEIFLKDLDYRNSIAMSIMQIGELSVGLTDDFRNSTKAQIPWGLIRGMRNMFAHTYSNMDKTIIWEVATQDIHGLMQFCIKILETDEF